MNQKFVTKDFIVITIIVSLWVNASEVFRYFIFVRPEMHEYLSVVPNVADMNWGIFAIWGLWDTLLTALYVFLFWLCSQAFGNNTKSVIISGIMSWCFFFVLFWVGMANMNLSSWSYLVIVLPLALIETLVASYIASKLYLRKMHNKLSQQDAQTARATA
ncbi:hypothetical protein DXX93_11170 [Thalassotalea euphylliae]|uniref:Uncharacterized protein n=1 Tax=Thalassotalea euphylliae TaxID=1655234 RepID=A0A3E0TR78_9GAMM|nr:hypothetical protein [Thalassotalea euphylliae]REL27069.1 hypothetical protein DXX93_11170 [Thalassotalea euphylliae]